MKLVIQIPCYNEEETLPITLADLPCELPGIDDIEVLVIDDGSTDRTVEAAERCKVDRIVRLGKHQGLAAAFRVGLQTALTMGADIIVHLDADHEFKGSDTARIIAPIVQGEADLVIGSRPIEDIPHYSWVKKKVQRLASRIVSWLAGTPIPDVTCGFRAYSRQTALRLNILSHFTYTLESILQASAKGLRMHSVPVHVNERLRESRLIRSTGEYVLRSALTVLRVYLTYWPLRFFLTFGSIFFVGGTALGLRLMYLRLSGNGGDHATLLITTVGLLALAGQMSLFGLIGQMMAHARRLVEEAHGYTRLREINGQSERTGSHRGPDAVSAPGYSGKKRSPLSPHSSSKNPSSSSSNSSTVTTSRTSSGNSSNTSSGVESTTACKS